MANLDLTKAEVRGAILKEIAGDENKRRKAESLRRFEVYRERQDRYITQKLESEFSQKTVSEMRKILSINLCPRIIEQLASLYKTSPERSLSEATEDQQKQFENLYKEANADVKFMLANRYYKLLDQCAIQVLPKDGEICLRVLLPHQYDVIPDVNDPEKAYAYIINVFDKFEYLSQAANERDLSNPSGGGYTLKSAERMDNINQSIADSEDYKKSLQRFEVWTDQLNFIMDGHGNIVSDDVTNPLGKLPFVDVAKEKDFEFWVRRGNGIVDFAIDFGAQLSDIANIIRLQGYAQAIVYAEKQPDNMIIGPNHVLFMQLDPARPEVKPSFEFVNPGSDLNASLEFLEMTLRLFLTSKGIDPKTVSGKLDAQSFNSGIERLLAMIDKFEGTKADMELFRCAEAEVYELMRDWSNYFQGTDYLDEDLRNGMIDEKSEFTLKYAEPQSVQTKAELEDSIIKLLDKGLITKKKAIMDIYEVGDDKAQEMIDDIKEEKALVMSVMPQPQNKNDMVDGQDSADSQDKVEQVAVQ